MTPTILESSPATSTESATASLHASSLRSDFPFPPAAGPVNPFILVGQILAADDPIAAYDAIGRSAMRPRELIDLEAKLRAEGARPLSDWCIGSAEIKLRRLLRRLAEIDCERGD